MKLLCSKVAATSSFEIAFDTLVQRGAGALLVGTFPWAIERRHKIMTLAARHKIPAMYPFSAFVFDGGLMSYGVGRGVFRLVGFHYVGQILKGAKPNDLPVQQPTKFELVINLKTARARHRRAGQAARPCRRGDRMT